MHFGWTRRVVLTAFAAALVGVALPAAPLATAAIAQSNQQAAVGARLMRGTVDLHYHVDPGYGVYDTLSEREREVFQLIAEGRVNKEIAEILHVSPSTVETHRARIMDKLDVRSAVEIVLYAVRKGIIS